MSRYELETLVNRLEEKLEQEKAALSRLQQSCALCRQNDAEVRAELEAQLQSLRGGVQ
jgi:bacterioferritin (cytochrome b1)